MHLCTNEWQGFSVLPLLAQMIVSISKEQYWPLSGTFNSLVPKSLLELEEFARSRRVDSVSKSLLGPEEFAGARRVCWGPKSLLGLEEFAGARRVCWGSKSLLGPEEFAGARRVSWGSIKSLAGGVSWGSKRKYFDHGQGTFCETAAFLLSTYSIQSSSFI